MKLKRKKLIEADIKSYFNSGKIIPDDYELKIYCDECVPYKKVAKKIRYYLKDIGQVICVIEDNDLKGKSDNYLTKFIFDDDENIIPILVTSDKRFNKEFPGLSLYVNKNDTSKRVNKTIKWIHDLLEENKVLNLGNLFKKEAR